MSQNFGYVYPYLGDTVLPLKTNVTQIVKSETYKKSSGKVSINGATDETKGTLAHKLLELYDFSSELPLGQQKNNLIESGLLDQNQLNDLSLDGIEKAINHPLLKDLK
ncbi:MAG: hypothetical protein J6R83_03890, partial [Clostridia bacterium]|nr:hypothetical protein [Clostridia bacterium]